MRPAAFLLVAAASAACASSALSEPRAAKAEVKLELSLHGKVAGAPVSCLPSNRTGDMMIVDDNTILFREGRNRVYRNDPPGVARRWAAALIRSSRNHRTGQCAEATSSRSSI